MARHRRGHARILIDEARHALGQHGAGRDGVAAHALLGELHRHRARERMHAALGGRVGVAPFQAAQGRDRPHVDDRAAAGRGDARDGMAAAQHGAQQVDVDGAPEFLQREFHHRAVVQAGAAGVVDQDVQRPMLGLGQLHRLPHAVLVGHVQARETRTRAGCGQLRGQRLAALGIDIAQQHARALGAEAARHGRADTDGRAGDEGVAPRKSSHSVSW
ncbi:Uncharacterised protein [Bordetella pertussis]|nr:Uncharacterised protein [Bordetella pertussis]